MLIVSISIMHIAVRINLYSYSYYRFEIHIIDIDTIIGIKLSIVKGHRVLVRFDSEVNPLYFFRVSGTVDATFYVLTIPSQMGLSNTVPSLALIIIYSPRPFSKIHIINKVTLSYSNLLDKPCSCRIDPCVKQKISLGSLFSMEKLLAYNIVPYHIPMISKAMSAKILYIVNVDFFWCTKVVHLMRSFLNDICRVLMNRYFFAER